MPTNSIFPVYDINDRTIHDGYVFTKNKFCEKCLVDSNKKCINYYKQIDTSIDDKYNCPYGLSTIVYKGVINTCLLLNESINKKTRKNLKDLYKSTIRFSEKQAIDLIAHSIDNNVKIEEYRETVHDLRNIASYFNSMIDEFKYENNDKELSSTEKSLISLYELINFRLDILYGKVDLTNIIEKEQKIHPIVNKLIHILKYKANQKGIKVNISPTQNNYFKITKSLYLSLFILLENSIKYSKPNNSIDILFIEDNEKSIIRIKNVTIKMNEKNCDELIKKGVRGSNAEKSGTPGSGIGLALAYDLLKKMGAELKIKIEDNRLGETFFYTDIYLFDPVTINH